jgi:four helix bundle protein
MRNRPFDLDERLLAFSVDIVRLVESMHKTRAANHVAGQLLRSGTSALPNHGEAQGAESKADFVHKMSICLKELRETERWLRLVQAVPLVDDDGLVGSLVKEVDELVRIFKSSIRTAKGEQGPYTP